MRSAFVTGAGQRLVFRLARIPVPSLPRGASGAGLRHFPAGASDGVLLKRRPAHGWLMNGARLSAAREAFLQGAGRARTAC